MSRFILTQEEDAIVMSALRAKANQYAAMFGITDPALEALIDKVESQLLVIEEVPVDVVEPTVQEVEAPKSKRSKSE